MMNRALIAADSPRVGGLQRLLLLALGWLSLTLGVIGVVLPLLPTAPFLLLAVACFARSAPQMVEVLYRMPLAGRYLRDWQQGGIGPRMKWAALAALWVTAFVTLATVAKTALAKALVLAATVLTSLHFLLMPIRCRNERKTPRD